MSPLEAKELAVVTKFQDLLRSGLDYSVDAMCQEVGEGVYLSTRQTRRIVNRYYRSEVTDAMIDFFNQLELPHGLKIQMFAEEFNLCEREGRLFIRYIRKKDGRLINK